MKTLSKAAQKRLDDQKRYLTSYVNAQLESFKDKFLWDYTDWQISRMERGIEEIRDSERKSEKTKQVMISRIQGKLDRTALLFMEHFNEANSLYNHRVEILVGKLMAFEVSANTVRFHWITNGFEFLVTGKTISGEEVEIDARIIYACGAVNAPHYRFITTKRKG